MRRISAWSGVGGGGGDVLVTGVFPIESGCDGVWCVRFHPDGGVGGAVYDSSFSSTQRHQATVTCVFKQGEGEGGGEGPEGRQGEEAKKKHTNMASGGGGHCPFPIGQCSLRARQRARCVNTPVENVRSQQSVNVHTSPVLVRV